MKKLGLGKTLCILIAFCAATAILSPAQTFTSLATFYSTNGSAPRGGLTQGTNGNFYGTTTFGPDFLIEGTVFEVTPAGVITTVHAFSCNENTCPNGGSPMNGVLLGANGNYYGLASYGGTNGFGTVFEIAAAGKFATVWNFCALEYCDDAGYPSSLMQASNQNLYGTSSGGGVYEHGTVFELTPGGKFTTLYSFCASINSGTCTDGENPQAALIEASNGNLYGSTSEGGANNDGGTIFEITPAGTLTTLYSFCAKANCADGNTPNGMIQAADGSFYGATFAGGTGSCDYGAGCGTIYEMTPAGKLNTLYIFCRESGCLDGSGPFSLIQANDGNFYGTTNSGGANGQGTIFELTAAGKLTTLYNFCSQADCTDGEVPEGGLLQATNGILYGTTIAGGADSCDSGCGTIFSLSAGLNPFVATVPTAGTVGTNVIILGNNLTGSTSVSFNGKAAAFTVVSDTEITATVPKAATTGTIDVATPGGTLASNVSFRVLN